MSLFGKLLKTTIDVATIPINVAEDVITFGGVLTDKEEPASVRKAKTLKKDCEGIKESIEKLADD